VSVWQEDSGKDKFMFFQLPSVLPIDALPTMEEIGEASKAVQGPVSLEMLPEGFLGKLLVYESGAVKLKLGDVIFDVSATSIILNLALVKVDVRMCPWSVSWTKYCIAVNSVACIIGTHLQVMVLRSEALSGGMHFFPHFALLARISYLNSFVLWTNQAMPGTNCVFAQELAAVNPVDRHCLFLGDIHQRVVLTPDIDRLLNRGGDVS
jgi:hypothetical protein